MVCTEARALCRVGARLVEKKEDKGKDHIQELEKSHLPRAWLILENVRNS